MFVKFVFFLRANVCKLIYYFPYSSVLYDLRFIFRFSYTGILCWFLLFPPLFLVYLIVVLRCRALPKITTVSNFIYKDLKNLI